MTLHWKFFVPAVCVLISYRAYFLILGEKACDPSLRKYDLSKSSSTMEIVLTILWQAAFVSRKVSLLAMF